MNHLKLLSVIILISLCLVACGNDQPVDPSASGQTSGEELYKSSCRGCHGSKGPDVSSSAEVHEVLRSGENPRHDFAENLSDEQIKAIGDYIMSVKE